jgi:hypothetical protein
LGDTDRSALDLVIAPEMALAASFSLSTRQKQDTGNFSAVQRENSVVRTP